MSDTAFCAHCAAPIPIKSDTRFVICSHCEMRLIIQRTTGGIHTRRNDQLFEVERSVARVEARLAELPPPRRRYGPAWLFAALAIGGLCFAAADAGEVGDGAVTWTAVCGAIALGSALVAPDGRRRDHELLRERERLAKQRDDLVN